MVERNVHKEMDALKEELSRLRNDLRDVTGQGRRTAEATADAARERVSQTGHSLMQEAQDLIDRLEQAGGTVRESGRDTVDQWRHRVEERPFSSSLTALGIGFALGLGFAAGWFGSARR